MLRWIFLLGLAGTLLTLSEMTTAQEPSTFRVNTRLVEVDVVVRSNDRAVTGLTKNDFRILDNGKPQSIATFSVRSNAAKSKTTTPLPSGTTSNRVSRTGEEPVAATVILLDRLNTAVEDQAYFGKELMKYLKTLQPGEHVAIYSLLKSLRIVAGLYRRSPTPAAGRVARRSPAVGVAGRLRSVGPEGGRGRDRECGRPH